MTEYELFAIRYASRAGTRNANFIGGDPHDGPMPMDYFIWLAKSPAHTFVIDLGFTAEVASQRQRDYLRTPSEGLAQLGGDAG